MLLLRVFAGLFCSLSAFGGARGSLGELARISITGLDLLPWEPTSGDDADTGLIGVQVVF